MTSACSKHKRFILIKQERDVCKCGRAKVRIMTKLQAETICTGKMRHSKETMELCVSQGSTSIQLQGQGICLPLWFLRFEPTVGWLHHFGPEGQENVMVVDGHLKVTIKQGERGGGEIWG